MPNPFFSIIIPTRNRAHLLKYLMQGVSNQNFQDYEVIVSNNNSSDNTEEIVNSIDCKKIKLYHTGADLSLVDNWNFALSKAEGEYIISLIADDDCITPNALSIYHKQIKENYSPDIMLLPNSWYVHPFYSNHNKAGNTLKIPILSKFERLGKQEIIDSYLNFNLKGFSPTYIIFKRDLINSMPLYLPPFPDFVAFMRLILKCETVVRTAYIGIIHGYAAESTGEQAFSNRKGSLEWEEAPVDSFSNVPLKEYFFINGWAESIIKALKIEKNHEKYNINWDKYFIQYYKELAKDRKWRNIDDDLTEYLKVLKNFKKANYDYVVARIEEINNEVSDQSQKETWINCVKYNVNNIFECACRFDEVFAKNQQLIKKANEAALFRQLFLDNKYETINDCKEETVQAKEAYHFFRGRAMYAEGNFKEAILSLGKYIDMENDKNTIETFIDELDYLTSAHYYIGLSNYHLGFYKDALKALLKCQKLSDGNHKKAEDMIKNLKQEMRKLQII